jgi:hypothetical protein
MLGGGRGSGFPTLASRRFGDLEAALGLMQTTLERVITRPVPAVRASLRISCMTASTMCKILHLLPTVVEARQSPFGKKSLGLVRVGYCFVQFEI